MTADNLRRVGCFTTLVLACGARENARNDIKEFINEQRPATINDAE
jgi:hypothetical protein